MKIATNKCFDSTSFCAAIAWKFCHFSSNSSTSIVLSPVYREHSKLMYSSVALLFFQFLIIIHEIGFVSKTNQNLLANTTFTSYLLQCCRAVRVLYALLSITAMPTKNKNLRTNERRNVVRTKRNVFTVFFFSLKPCIAYLARR